MSNFNHTVFTLLLSSTVATAASTITMPPSAQAEQIVIPVGTQAATSTLDRPTQGMSGHDVIAQFGEPISSSSRRHPPSHTGSMKRSLSTLSLTGVIQRGVKKNDR